jgi:hypothetical protein
MLCNLMVMSVVGMVGSQDLQVLLGCPIAKKLPCLFKSLLVYTQCSALLHSFSVLQHSLSPTCTNPLPEFENET